MRRCYWLNTESKLDIYLFNLRKGGLGYSGDVWTLLVGHFYFSSLSLSLPMFILWRAFLFVSFG